MTGDRVIRLTMAAVVCAVAAFAAVVSYSHIYGLGRAHGQDGTAPRDLWHVTRFHTDAPEAVGRSAHQLDCPWGYHGTARGYPCQDCGRP